MQLLVNLLSQGTEIVVVKANGGGSWETTCCDYYFLSYTACEEGILSTLSPLTAALHVQWQACCTTKVLNTDKYRTVKPENKQYGCLSVQGLKMGVVNFTFQFVELDNVKYKVLSLKYSICY